MTEKPDTKRTCVQAGFVLTLLMNLVVAPLQLSWMALGIFLFPVLFTALKLTMQWDREKITRQLIWIYARGSLMIMAPFVRYHTEGLNRNNITPPCILVANHLSFLDLYSLALLPFGDISVIVRDWPFKMLWYAPFMYLAGYLNVENMPWQRVSEGAARILSRGGSLLIFPEGHRSRSGHLQRFYSGAFRLAVETGVKIVPICIAGTNELLPPGRRWLKPARVMMRALNPIDPACFTGPLAHRDIRKFVKSVKTVPCLSIAERTS